MGLPYQRTDFILGPSISGPRLVRIYVSTPTQFEMDHLGHLFVLSELDQEGTDAEHILHTIEEELKRNYYSTEHEDISQNVEEALTKTNRSLQELIEQFGVDWLSHLNLVVAILHGKELHLAHVGTVHAFLTHNRKIVDILDSSGTSRYETVNPLKVFSNVISGTVAEGDHLILSTTTVLDYLSLEKIRKSFVELGCLKATEHLKQLLSEANPETIFCLLAIWIQSTQLKKKKLPPVEEGIPSEDPKPIISIIDEDEVPSSALEAPLRTPQNASGIRYDSSELEATDADSLSQLQAQEQRTSHLLSPTFSHRVTSSVSRVSYRLQQIRNLFSGSESPEASTLPERLRIKQQQSGKPKTIIAKLSRLVVFALTGLADLVLRGIRALTSLGSHRTSSGTWKSVRPPRTVRLISSLKRAPTRTKLLLAASLVFLFVFALIITRDSSPASPGTAKIDYDALLASARENVQEANAVLIYGNEADARTFLSKALSDLQQIPEDQGTVSKEAQQLQTETKNTLNRINGVTVLENPNPWVDLATSHPSAIPDRILIGGGNIWLYQKNGTRLYQITISSRSIKEFTPQISFGIQTIVLSGTNVLLIGENESALLNPTTNAVTPQTITFPGNQAEIVSAQLFNGRLYTLDRNGVVYRHDAVSQGFAEGVRWITDQTTISNPTTLHIDGSVYVASGNGTILRFFTGVLDSKAPSYSTEPSIGSGMTLTSSELSKTLYVTDPQNARVLSMSKDDGSVRGQWTSTNFTDLKASVADESQHKLYLLNGRAVYQIDLPS